MKKSILPVVVVIVAAITFLSSFSFFLRQKSGGNPVTNALKDIVGKNQTTFGSIKPTAIPTPEINWTNVRVPEPGESPTEEGLAVPKYTYGTAAGKKERTFEITLSQNKFSHTKIIVNQDDIVRIYLTAVDKKYDFTFLVMGNSIEVSPGPAKPLVFQAMMTGKFVFTCQTCGGNKLPEGVLLVKPSS